MPTLICEVEEGDTGRAREFAVTVREHTEPSYRLQADGAWLAAAQVS